MPATLTATPSETSPPPARRTSEEFYAMGSAGDGYELVNGILVGRKMSTVSSYVGGEVYARLREFARPRRLGWSFPPETAFRSFPDDPDKVRKADAAFTRLNRLTAEVARRKGFCPVTPDLVVEVVSPNDLAYEVDDKRAEWLEAGAQLVWVVHPVRRTVHAYAADGTVKLFGPADELTAAPVLPDFRCPVVELFVLPGEVGA